MLFFLSESKTDGRKTPRGALSFGSRGPRKGFVSWSKTRKLDQEKIRNLLRLGDTFHGEESFFQLSDAHGVYSFLEDQVENFSEDVWAEPASQEKLRSLIAYLKTNYGDKVRLIRFGQGNDWVFWGYHMIVIQDENGCLFGIKRETVWT